MKTILVALAFTVGGAAWAANPPLNVAVSNTPLPVTVTNATPNQNVTITGTANVTVANTNPIPVTNSDRPTAFNQSFATTGFFATLVPVPTGCRLVVQVVSFNTADSAATAHLPTIAVGTNQGGTLASYIIPAQQVANTSNPIFTVGTLALQLIVDSPNDLFVTDALAPANTNAEGFWSISGYLLRLAPDASC